MPSASAEQMRRVVELCDQSDVPYRTLPKVQDILDGTARSQDLRRVSLDDLLGREPVSLDEERIRKRIADKRVLITGGGGSIGSELCRQVARLKPREIVLLEQTEFSLYSIALEITEEFPDVTLHTRLGDICDEPGVVDVFLAHQPEVVFHAAAYKHVPSLQEQVRETIRNNVLGTEIVSRVARKHACETFALISTDKAVNPASVMGASKRLAEMLIQAQNSLSSTSFITVRFGNVLGSAGSVVPLFEKQIYEGGPVTVTDPQVTRYFMTLSEACQLILQASVLGQGSEIFVLEMGEPVKVDYLARQLIRMSGLIPGRDIDIVYTGLRPGEKLDEELFHYDEKLAETTHDKIRLAESRSVDPEKIKEGIEKLIEASRKADSLAMNEILKHLVPEYKTEQPFDEMQQLA
jgi:FlaA1/EpsC-like NDP-sugar epimerase